MNVSLGVQWEQFVTEKVQSGRYQTASEVLRDGLRLLEQREQVLKRVSFRNKAELEDLLEAGIAELDSGKGIAGEVALKTLRERAAARRRTRG
jgi:antitoxin ParD1/3/4